MSIEKLRLTFKETEREEIKGTHYALDTIEHIEFCRGMAIGAEVQLLKALDSLKKWLIKRRQKLQEKKERHITLKPHDAQGAMLYGIKARALQEVINYLNREVEDE